MEEPLKELLLAINLGLSRDHRLAGWHILTILYHDSATGGVPITLGYLAQKYNSDYLDRDEKPLKDDVLKRILEVLSEQAKLIEVSPRKVRVQMKSGGYHTQQSYVYKITSSGIEYLSVMHKVIDADNTVAANITRINEYCHLVEKLATPDLNVVNTQLYNDFQNMVSAYNDVMKGMHKLDDDLSELANDLAFNHGGKAAEHLQAMLKEKAVPAFTQLLSQGPRLQALATSSSFSERVAHSQQGDDDLDTAHAVGDRAKMLLRFNKARDYVYRQLHRLAASFDPSASAIDNSLDTVYLLFQTILKAIRLLSQEYDHVQSQSVDIKALTGEIDQLMMHYQTINVPAPIPQHLPQDRFSDDAGDLLAASSIGPVIYVATNHTQAKLTAADNPVIADVVASQTNSQAGLEEFKRLVMQDETHGVVNHDLELKTIQARDELARLYGATGYNYYTSFALFGRPLKRVVALPSGEIKLHCIDESYQVTLPSGFEFWFEK
nr:hypothetical protein [Levilactobacillus tujiorum]